MLHASPITQGLPLASDPAFICRDIDGFPPSCGARSNKHNGWLAKWSIDGCGRLWSPILQKRAPSQPCDLMPYVLMMAFP